MRQVGRYHVEDPAKIQGRDDVWPSDRNPGGLRLRYALQALAGIRGRVLVPGCGAGRYVRAIARVRPDLTLVGGDLSLTALREARWRHPSGCYLALDAARLPFSDCAFSAAVFFDLLEHLPDYRGMLAEIARVLRPGGVLHAYVPLEAQPATIYRLLAHSQRFPIHRWKRDHVGHINRFDDEQVLRLVWEAGLEVRQVAYSFHPVGQLHDLADYWQRERQAGGPGWLPLTAVRWVTRAVFAVTWRLAYLEDRAYRGRVLASGLHLMAIKP